LSNEAVVVKLLNGDMFMAYHLNSTPDTLLVLDPVSIKAVQVATEGGIVEKTMTQPFCSLTLEREYSFDMRMVLYVKPLNPKIAKHFGKLIQAFNEERSEDNDFGQSMFDDELEEQHEEEQLFNESILVIPEKHQIH
jgi:hypothetical protein